MINSSLPSRLQSSYIAPAGPVVAVLVGHEHEARSDPLSLMVKKGQGQSNALPGVNAAPGVHAMQYVALPAYNGGRKMVEVVDWRV